MDTAVLALLGSLDGGEQDCEVVEMTVECLGRIALCKDSWRDALRNKGAPDMATRVIERFHRQRGQRKLVKYTFWFAATLSGIRFVAEELHRNLQSSEVVDAAFCTVIDVLDDDIEGEWVLTQAGRCAEGDVPPILGVVLMAMQGHQRDPVLQSRGCHCVGLLLPMAPLDEVALDAVRVVLAAARRHPRSADVARDVCYALRALLELSHSVAGPAGGAPEAPGGQLRRREALVQELRNEQVDEVMERFMVDFATTEEPGLLEDAAVVLASLSGIDAVLKALVDAAPGPVRTSGVKALFEFGRQHPQPLRESAAKVITSVQAMLAESASDCSLQQNAELLFGLCSACAGSAQPFLGQLPA